MKRTIEESENSILLLEEEKEKLEINIKENSENNKTLSGKLLTSRTELAEAITETEAEEKELLLNRASSIKDIPQDHLKYYDKYRLARDGIGIAEVTRNSCGSCYNYLTPQAIIEIKDRDKLILCSNCGVYLYYDSEE
jgi:predicted  nucleic acid-binding Zn-ribbon protein